MQRRKNAGKSRSKKSPLQVPAAPFGSPLPPSPPLFMLDDYNDPSLVAGSPGLRSGSLSPAASLPDLSAESQRSHTDDSPSMRVGLSHTVSPTIASETSVMDHIAQAVRYMYPSANHSYSPKDRSKRRPISFSGFLANTGSNRRGNVGSLIATSLSPLLTPLNVAASPRSSGPIPEVTSEDEERGTRALSTVDNETILTSAWSTLRNSTGDVFQFLLLGYEQGFQIWDTTLLDSIKEIIHLKEDPFNRPVYGMVLISIPLENKKFQSRLAVALLIGLKGQPDTDLVIYCMQTHRVIWQTHVPGAMELEANSQAIAISTVRPSAIRLFSLVDFSEARVFNQVSSRPAFALSNRLIAYASPPPTEQDRYKYSKTPLSARSPRSITPLGSAYKVGHGILTGMRTLSTMAAIATSGRISGSDHDADAGAQPRIQTFSRSAPASAPLSGISGSASLPSRHGSQPSPSLLDLEMDYMSYEGTWLTIVDLLAENNEEEIHRFQVSGSKPVVRLQWDSGGTTLYCATSGGQTVVVYSVRPDGVAPVYRTAPSATEGARGRASQRGQDGLGVPWHLYDLHRGHSAAHILNIAPSPDGRWVGVHTHRGTIHVFATNPYGGTPDVSSHVNGRVSNPTQLQPLSTSLLPLLRIRPSTTTNSDEGDPAPTAMRFLSLDESGKLPAFLAPRSPNIPDKECSQDLLVFQPATGMLELFRITVDVTQQPPPPTSTRSSPRQLPVGQATSALTRLIDSGQSLRGKECTVARWDLRRRHDWPEVRQNTAASARSNGNRHQLGNNWVAYAEIDTFSRCPRVLPPSIYLSHQFTFHSFLEDYDALLRSERFNVPTEPIAVRNEVQVSAYAAELNDSLMRAEGQELHESRYSVRQGRLDNPMAMAIGEQLEYTQSPAVTYPMLPNGASSYTSRSLLESIPIRKGAHLAMELTGGVGEGLGKLRREIAKVRSPSIRPVPDTSTDIQELEDEELLDVDPDAVSSRMTSEAEASLRTPEGGREDQELADRWDEWGAEDEEAVAEAERFDEIYPAGVMDEDCEGTEGDGEKGPRVGSGRRGGRRGRKRRG